MERIFRGKTFSQDEHFDDGEWVEGYYICFNGKEHRIYSGYAETDCGDYYPDWFNVRPETVGQYTGLTDKNGKKIFEGDICQIKGISYIDETPFVVEWNEEFSGWFWRNLDFGSATDTLTAEIAETSRVIGNIHDNKELLEVK